MYPSGPRSGITASRSGPTGRRVADRAVVTYACREGFDYNERRCHCRGEGWEDFVTTIWSSLRIAVFTATMAIAGISSTRAQEMNALKELAAAANKEGTVTLSWSGSTFGGIQGAARFQAGLNKAFGTNIRV